MNNAEKKKLIRIIVASALFAAGWLTEGTSAVVSIILFGLAYACIAYDVLWNAVRNILHGDVFDENFLMAVASIGALCIGLYAEGVVVVLFYQIGELFQARAVAKSRRSISDLMDIRPDSANVLRDGKLQTIDPDEVKIGESIVIRPGEKIPLDSTVLSGSSMVDTAALTGESVPREVGKGDSLLSGCINQSGELTARVEKEFGESTASKILDLVENASSKKSRPEAFITRLARWYTPAVVIAAVLLAVLPPLLIPGAVFADWLYRALVFLVISCPCALVISVPLSFFGGIGGASRMGVLVKGSNCLETLAQTDTVVFDKTGTLTKGVFRVQQIVPQGCSAEELLRDAALAESGSTHPIAVSLRDAWGKTPDLNAVSDVQEIAGHGVIARVEGKAVCAGNAKLMRREGIPFEENTPAGTAVHVAIDGRYAGYLIIADEPKPDAAEAIRALKRCGIRRTVMLTGDSKPIAEATAGLLGLDEVHAELLPADKVEQMEQLLNKEPNGKKLAFVGDGINDAPVLARADLGIAMGGLGSDAAIEAADLVLMTDEPSRLADAILLARRTLRIAKQNIVFALAVKFAVLALGALGLANMWEAVFADVGVSILAILNAIRVLRVQKSRVLPSSSKEAGK